MPAPRSASQRQQEIHDDFNILHLIMAKSIIYKHYQRILSQWPVDLFRPNVSFQTVMRRRIDKRFKPSTIQPEDLVASNNAQAAIPTSAKFDEKAELEQVNVLYSFLENRYAKKYPLSDQTLKPASKPAYYENLLKEFEEAPHRSWFGSLINKWKGLVRFS